MRRIVILAVMAALASAAPARGQSESQPSAAEPAAEATAELGINAKLGTGVEERELVGEGNTLHVDDTAYLWMRITGGPADSVTVTWSIDEHTYDVELAVGAVSWRTWSSKKLWKAGDWTVEVRDADGTSLYRNGFSVTPR